MYIYIYIQYTQCAFEELLYIGVYFSVKQHLRRTYQSRRWTSSNMCGRNYHIIIQLSNIVCVLLFLGIQYVFEFVYSTGSISVMSNYYNEQWMETILHQLVDGLSHYCKAHVLQCFIVPNTTGFPDFVHLQDSSTFHNVFQPICPDSSLKWWSSSIKDWCLVQCSATLGAAQLRRVFFFNGMMGNLQQTRIVGEKRWCFPKFP